MTKEEIIALGINEEAAEKLYQSISQLEEENTGLKEQLSEKERSLKDLEAAKAQAEAAAEQFAREKEAYNAEIASLKLNSGIEKALIFAGAKNLKAVGSLLDREKISFDENGDLTGLAEQLSAIKESDSYLFKDDRAAQSVVSGLVGYTPEEGADENSEGTDFSQMTYSQITDYLAKAKAD